mgnify:CR=1 FL=1
MLGPVGPIPGGRLFSLPQDTGRYCGCRRGRTPKRLRAGYPPRPPRVQPVRRSRMDEDVDAHARSRRCLSTSFRRLIVSVRMVTPQQAPRQLLTCPFSPLLCVDSRQHPDDAGHRCIEGGEPLAAHRGRD